LHERPQEKQQRPQGIILLAQENFVRLQGKHQQEHGRMFEEHKILLLPQGIVWLPQELM
jgi:hypothetical protein